MFPRRENLKFAGTLLSIAAAYFVAGRLGLAFATVEGSVTLIWPPTGIAVAAVLLYGYRVWPALALGVFLTTASGGAPLGLAAFTMIGTPLQALAAVYLLRRFAKFDPALERAPDVWWFIAFAVAFSPTISATIGVVGLCQVGLAPWAEFSSVWFQWWLGDATGVLLIAPVLLTCRGWLSEKWQPRYIVEGSALLASVIIVNILIAGRSYGIELTAPLFYTALPFVAWAGFRFEQRGSATAVLIVAAVAVWLIVVDPAQVGSGEESEAKLVSLYSYLCVVAVLAMLLAAAVAERRRAQAALEASHGALERMVEARTADLETANLRLRSEIEERKQAEATLRESEERLQQAIQLSGVGYWVWDAIEDRCTYCSQEHARIHGTTVDDYIARSSKLEGNFPFTHPEDREKLKAALKALRNGRNFELEYRVVTPSGDVRHVQEIAKPIRDATGIVIGEHGTLQDTTETKLSGEAVREKDERLRELQSQLLHASRLSATGQMSSALAHELNQPLAAIMNYGQASQRIMQAEGHVSARAHDLTEKVLEQADRAGEIIRSLRRLLESRELKTSAEDVNSTIEEVCPLALVGTRAQGINVMFDLDKSLPPVAIDKIQIQQVLFNLIRNGTEAMVNLDRRDLTITTSSGGNYLVEVAVGDTGAGLPKEIEERLFQPLVTSKEDGMGLGLSISQAIIDSHGGHLRARSNPGGGTIFSFTLPVADPADASHPEGPLQVASTA